MIVLIGYGNPQRRDDGAGPALAGLVKAWGGRDDLKVLISHQLVPELAEDLAVADVTAVLFLDASVGSSRVGAGPSIRSLDTTVSSPAFGHQFSPVDLLCYVELFRGAPLPAWQVTIPGMDFDFGEGLSSYSRKNLSAAFKNLQVFLRNIHR